MSLPVAGIYPILDAERLAELDLPGEALARAMDRLAIGMVQLRCKGTVPCRHAFAHVWLPIFRRHAPSVKIIINDDVELALRLDADGVHLGQEDGSAREARLRLGPGRMLGISTHQEQELRQAVQDGADYVGFGPVFATTSKNDAQAVQGLTALQAIKAASPVPVVAIGGISPDRVARVAATGADAAAMISGLLDRDWQERLERSVRHWQQARA